MRVFVTGATGFIGSAVVNELIGAGHQVLGLSRSDEGAEALAAAGAQVHRGDIQDLESLRSGAAASDGVIHAAFVHDFSKFKESCEIDRKAIETIGSVLAGSDRPLIVTAGLGGIAGPGQTVTEDMDIPKTFAFPRVSEQTALSLVQKRVHASVMRLPQVHNTVKQGFVSLLIATARQKGVSAIVGDGANRWAAAHVDDVAHLYRLALEKNEAGAKYHAIAEQGVPLRDIAQTIARGLKVPFKSIPPDAAPAHFGFLTGFVGADLIGSSALTRKKLNWNPTGQKLIADLEQMDYSVSAEPASAAPATR
jgi:nucleoside-diphosphate-sugar epimerase